MKEYLPKRAVFACLLLLFLQYGWSQTVSPIRINDSNARIYRDSLKLKIFGSTQFPYNFMPDAVETNVSSIDYYNGSPYNSIVYPAGNLDSIDKFVVTLESDPLYFPSTVKVYLFHPHNSNGKLFIYHSGHCAGSATVEDVTANNNEDEPGLVIPALIAQGYTVLAVPMLTYKSSPGLGYTCSYNGHNELFMDNHYPFPLRFFFKPLIASLNLLGRSNYSAIYMCGLSGGGWVTSIYPAIDSSITKSFPIAGSWPMPLRYKYYPALGDYEQTYLPQVEKFLDYHELYTLACLAPARQMLQINNRYDPCCFNGMFAHIFYADSVVQALKGTQGTYKFYLDETGTDHSVTSKAVQVMLRFIQADTAFLQNPPLDSTSNGSVYNYDIKNNFATVIPSGDVDLRYVLLKGPAWLSMDEVNGRLTGFVPQESLIVYPDTVSFKVEDPDGRFAIYNYLLKRKREHAYFFTKGEEDSVLYFLPQYLHSLETVNQTVVSAFQFNNPMIHVTEISVVNNSFLKLRLDHPVSQNDSVMYRGYLELNPIRYKNGLKLENSDMRNIVLDAVKENIAVPGMIRFNKDSLKFEYFNGKIWINMNQ